jgi:hypothetical protein
MADVYSRNEIAANNSTSGSPVFTTTFGANALKNRISQSDAGREIVLSLASDSTINDAELNAAISEITRSQGSAGSGDSAFTIAAVGTADGSAFVSGTTATVFLRCQGTGNLTVADIKSAAEGATGGGSGTFTATVLAIFAPAL